jgi:transcriptional regulator with XRE-family HTH domain
MGKNFKQLRADAHLRQKDISVKFGISVQTINKWERGRAPVARKHWPELAAMLHVSVDELEAALIQTLLDACMERGSTDMLKNAKISGVYRSELVRDAFTRFSTYPAPSTQAAPLELREEILRLREENLKLRERIFELEQMLNIPSGGVSTVLKSSSNHELETVK